MDDEYFHGETIEPREVHLLLRTLKIVLALLVIVGILYVFNLQNYFFYSRTPEINYQAQSEVKIEAHALLVPLIIFVIRSDGFLGSQRDNDNIRNLVEQSDNIWHQANIDLEIRGIYEVLADDEEIRLFYKSPNVLISQANKYSPESINLFLVGQLSGTNGVSYGGLASISVADFTTVYDFRVLAHEIGHQLGLSHVDEARGRLMYRGANGIELTVDEIEVARSLAERF
jgi:hypothetical protein